MRPFRLALLASCMAFPAFAQEVPSLDQTAPFQSKAEATARPNIAQAQAEVAQSNMHVQTQPQVAGQGSVPRRMPPPINPVSPDKPMTPKERVGVAVARTWINRFQRPHLDADGVEHFTSGKGQVFVVTAVDHITDIALAPGEIIAPPLHVGDATDWHFHPAVSGSGRHTVQHILVKPDDAGLNTNIVIETNKRTISVALTSRRRDYMPLVSLDIADNTDAVWGANAGFAVTGREPAANVASPCDQTPIIPPSQFRISGDDVPWRPLQVYVVSTPVGDKTCVEFPSDIGSQSIPAMLALADDGGWFSDPTKQVINVRYTHRRYIADELLNRFILVDGVGGDQKTVTVTRRH